MDTGFLKSFLPEIFFSLAIFFQLIFNSRFINKVTFNFPIVYKETFYQTLVIFICLAFIYCNLRIEGFFSNYLFVNDAGCVVLKITVVFFTVLTLFFIIRSFSFQYINFFEYFTVFLLSFLLTFVKGGVLELTANATNSMLFFIFTTVNLLVIVNHFKNKDRKDQPASSNKTIQGFLNMFPWYAIIGFVLALIFLVISPQYYSVV